MRLKKNVANQIDAHVGSRVRLRRMLMGISQEKLGEALGLTFQQIQKYERGANRIGASRLFDLSRVLDVPISYFFDDMDDDVANHRPPRLETNADQNATLLKSAEVLTNRETIELLRAYYDIDSAEVRRKTVDLLRILSLQNQMETSVGDLASM